MYFTISTFCHLLVSVESWNQSSFVHHSRRLHLPAAATREAGNRWEGARPPNQLQHNFKHTKPCHYNYSYAHATISFSNRLPTQVANIVAVLHHTTVKMGTSGSHSQMDQIEHRLATKRGVFNLTCEMHSYDSSSSGSVAPLSDSD